MRPSLQRLLAPYFFFWARLVLRKHHPRIVAVTVLPPACEADWVGDPPTGCDLAHLVSSRLMVRQRTSLLGPGGLAEPRTGPENGSPSEALSHVLSHAVGNKESEIWPEISSLNLQPGDTLLLCTDGLTKHLADPQIAELVAKAESAKEACAWLIDAALKDGGSDNVTVVVTRLLA